MRLYKEVSDSTTGTVIVTVFKHHALLLRVSLKLINMNRIRFPVLWVNGYGTARQRVLFGASAPGT